MSRTRVVLSTWMRLTCSILLALVAFKAVLPGDQEATSTQPTYAERLGWSPRDRVVIFHADDLGMHRDVNVGTIAAMENGLVNSTSTMMPCPWVPDYAAYLRDHPDVDNGLHLTLTSEWNVYRWGPLAGAGQVPGLVDRDGYLHREVRDVVQNASADEVEREIRAQIALARRMGIPVTHLDTHMGTLAATRAFYERLVKVGIEMDLPIMAVGGHGTQARQQWPGAEAVTRPFLERIWEAGLPVLDDLDMRSYGWHGYEEKKQGMIQSLRELQPGITQIIVHAAHPSDTFPHVVRNTEVRYNDLRVMTDPDVIRVAREEGLILTTWHELHERRKALGGTRGRAPVRALASPPQSRGSLVSAVWAQTVTCEPTHCVQ
jgi:chitin disaccharide deacetylase